MPDDIVTWGSLLNLGRQNLEAWWLIIYPGMAIFLTITIYNMIAEASRDALDPKLKASFLDFIKINYNLFRFWMCLTC